MPRAVTFVLSAAVAAAFHSSQEGDLAAFVDINQGGALTANLTVTTENGNCGAQEWFGSPENEETWLPLPGWLKAPLPPTKGFIKPKLGFLMMIYETISFPKAWAALLSEPRTNFSMIIHSKRKAKLPPFFERFLWRSNVDLSNAWCQNANMILEMARKVLHDDADVSHVVTVSGDAMPVKPLAHMYKDLARDDSSRFCADREWKRAETFFVLNRQHAELLVKHQQIIRNMFAMITKDSGLCEDEDQFFWPLARRHERILDSCLMMTDWTGTGKYWRANSERCQCPGFIASKKVAGSCDRPALFLDISPQGFEELLTSPAGYWFARKFPGDGVKGKVVINGETPLDDVASEALVSLRGVMPKNLLETKYVL